MSQFTAIVALFGFLSVLSASVAAYNISVEMHPTPVCQDQDLTEAKNHYAACMTRWMTSSHECTAQAVKLSCKKWGRP